MRFALGAQQAARLGGHAEGRQIALCYQCRNRLIFF